MSSSQPDRKRVRVDDEAQKAFSNHPSLYFDDGNIILSSGSTLFRVHRSLLSKHSAVFRELFEPKEDKKQMYLRECVHIPVEDDREEMEALLNIIYDGLRIDFPHLTVENFPQLANLLRMSTKYQLVRTRTEIIQRLQKEWPVTLGEHDAKMDERRRQHPHTAPFVVQGGRVGFNAQYNRTAAAQPEEVVHPASVIALLRQSDYATPELLATLFYELSCCTWAFGGPAIGHNVAALTHADLERLLIGVERLRRSHMYYATMDPGFVLPVAHERACLPGMHRCWSDMARAFAMKVGPHEPLEDWKEMARLVSAPGSQLPHAYQICLECFNILGTRLKDVRAVFWAGMCTNFELIP